MTNTPPTPEHDKDDPAREGVDYVFWVGTAVIVIVCVVIVVGMLKR